MAGAKDDASTDIDKLVKAFCKDMNDWAKDYLKNKKEDTTSKPKRKGEDTTKGKAQKQGDVRISVCEAMIISPPCWAIERIGRTPGRQVRNAF